MRSLSLTGRAVVITGGGGGIGRETAIAMAGAGARVAVADIDLAAARDTVRLLGSPHRAYAADVRDRDSFGELLESAGQAMGPPLVLVNNAGVMPVGRFAEEPEAVTRRTIDVNLWGVIHGTRLVLPGMIERGQGHIVNVASMMGRMHAPGAATYGASKHAVVGLGGGVRAELAGTGVTLTTILPSAARTALISGIDLGPFPPLVEPYEVAAAILASCRHRRAEVAVPRWLGRAPEIERLLPSRAIAALRLRLGGDAAMNRVDAETRAPYERKVLGAELAA